VNNEVRNENLLSSSGSQRPRTRGLRPAAGGNYIVFKRVVPEDCAGHCAPLESTDSVCDGRGASYLSSVKFPIKWRMSLS
jgi:hypothetical protein